MSVVPCLPAHLCVSPQRPVAGPPRERVKSVSPPAGLPNPRVPLGATNPEQRVAAARRSSQLAAQRSISQRSAAARSATQRQRRVRHGARSAVQSIVLTAQRPWKRCTDQDSCISPIGRPEVPSADQQGRVNHLHNHRLTSTSRTPNPVLQHPPQQPHQFVELNECTSRTSRPTTPPLPW